MKDLSPLVEKKKKDHHKEKCTMGLAPVRQSLSQPTSGIYQNTRNKIKVESNSCLKDHTTKLKKATPSTPPTMDISVILNYAPGLKPEEYKTHSFKLTYKKDYINSYCFILGFIELRKFKFERYHHISHGIRNYFESQFAKKPTITNRIKSIDE